MKGIRYTKTCWRRFYIHGKKNLLYTMQISHYALCSITLCKFNIFASSWTVRKCVMRVSCHVVEMYINDCGGLSSSVLSRWMQHTACCSQWLWQAWHWQVHKIMLYRWKMINKLFLVDSNLRLHWFRYIWSWYQQWQKSQEELHALHGISSDWWKTQMWRIPDQPELRDDSRTMRWKVRC